MTDERKKKILVVDDETDHLDLIKEILEKEKLDVVTVQTAKEALDVLSKQDQTIDLILADMIMPDINGWELVRRVRKELKMEGIPFIAISGACANFDKEKATSNGVDCYLQKPEDYTRLREVILDYLKD